MIGKTDRWIKKYIKEAEENNANTSDRIKLQQDYVINPLLPYFNGANTMEIQQHLYQFGLFIPHKNEKDKIVRWLKKDFKSHVQKIYQYLQSKWDGPSPSIFILPSNEENRELSILFNGSSGLSYPDKLFLFLPVDATTKQLAALFIHEYSHVCRLHHLYKENQEMTILDAIILEGIAEVIVRKKLGKDAGNQYIRKLDNDVFERYWNRWIKGKEATKRHDHLHDKIMSGSHSIPKNLGYLLGYHLVNQYAEENSISMKKLLYLENEIFLSSLEERN